MTGRLPHWVFLISTGLLLFVAGVAVGRYRVFPFGVLMYGVDSVSRTVSTLMVLSGRPVDFLKPARYPGRGVTRFQRDDSVPGITLLTGFFEGGNELRLIRSDGSLIHRWPVRLFDVFPDLSHMEPRAVVPATNWNTTIHGAVALPDGSVVFNFDGQGTVKLTRCGAVAWTLPRMTHHTLERSEDGGFWVADLHRVTKRTAIAALTPPYNEDIILKLSSEGQVLQEISVPQLLSRNNLLSLILGNGLSGIALASGSITHTNDVEELTHEMSVHFPEFAPGDLLLSLRSLNLLAVVDPSTTRVKWHQTGPWIKQHDPDFLADGTISVFNNNNDDSDGDILGGSNVMRVNPLSGDTTVIYGDRPGQRFFTGTMGKHQPLADGHTLITESFAGRAFEVNREGQVVWEYINRYDADEVALITQATRYPETYFTVDNWSCP